MIEIRHSNMHDTEDTHAAYNQLYRGAGILLRDSFYLWLLDLLQPEPGQLLLDVSCGQGRLVKFAQEKGLLAMGMDFAEEAVYKGLSDSPQSGWSVAAKAFRFEMHVWTMSPISAAWSITKIRKRGCAKSPECSGHQEWPVCSSLIPTDYLAILNMFGRPGMFLMTVISRFNATIREAAGMIC
jgi:hypothetical protein